MNATAERVRSADVTLGELARENAAHFEVSESDVKRARAVAVGHYYGADYLEVIVMLPDGRRAWLGCSHADPGHVVDMRLL